MISSKMVFIEVEGEVDGEGECFGEGGDAIGNGWSLYFIDGIEDGGTDLFKL